MENIEKFIQDVFTIQTPSKIQPQFNVKNETKDDSSSPTKTLLKKLKKYPCFTIKIEDYSCCLCFLGRKRSIVCTQDISNKTKNETKSDHKK